MIFSSKIVQPSLDLHLKGKPYRFSGQQDPSVQIDILLLLYKDKNLCLKIEFVHISVRNNLTYFLRQLDFSKIFDILKYSYYVLVRSGKDFIILFQQYNNIKHLTHYLRKIMHNLQTNGENIFNLLCSICF